MYGSLRRFEPAHGSSGFASSPDLLGPIRPGGPRTVIVQLLGGVVPVNPAADVRLVVAPHRQAADRHGREGATQAPGNVARLRLDMAVAEDGLGGGADELL